MARVILEDLRKEYGETVAVTDFTVDVVDGEFVTFLGPSGCGKTTCLRMVAGFIRPTRGSVAIGDQVVSDLGRGIFVPPERRGVGMVFQSYAVWPHMTVFDNVAYPLKIKKTPRAEVQRQVGQVLELVKMPELGDRYPHQLSGGQQQRVALARALVMDPEVLLLDEPLSNLDAKLREEMRIELKELQRETGVTIIFVTHDQLEAMVLSDRVVVMEAGAVQQIGTPQEIYSEPANRFVADFIGTANFLEAEVDGSQFRLLVRPQVGLPMADPTAVTSGRVTLMVRPEDITMSRDVGALEAVIDKKIYLGEAIEYIVPVGETVLRVKVDTRQDYPVGQTVRLTLENYHLFR